MHRLPICAFPVWRQSYSRRSLGWSSGQGFSGSPPVPAALCAGLWVRTGWPLFGPCSQEQCCSSPQAARLHFSPLQCSHKLICLIRWAYLSSVHFGKGKLLCADYWLRIQNGSVGVQNFTPYAKNAPSSYKSLLSISIFVLGLEKPFSPKPQQGTWLVPVTMTASSTEVLPTFWMQLKYQDWEQGGEARHIT